MACKQGGVAGCMVGVREAVWKTGEGWRPKSNMESAVWRPGKTRKEDVGRREAGWKAGEGRWEGAAWGRGVQAGGCSRQGEAVGVGLQLAPVVPAKVAPDIHMAKGCWS